jgi:hypothetical protein
MRPHAKLAQWQRLPSARERRAHQLLMCRSGAHAALTSVGCGLFQRRCSACGQLFDTPDGRLEPAGPGPELRTWVEAREEEGAA